MIAYGAGPALGLASGPLLARAMGPEGRGQFAAIMQPITLAGAVASIGIPAAATYFVAKGSYNGPSVLRRGLILSSVFATLAYAMLIVYSDALSVAQGISREFLLMIWLLIYVAALYQIMRGYVQGRGRWRILDTERWVFAVARFVGVAVLALTAVSAAEDYALVSLGAFVICGVILWWPDKGRYHADRSLPPLPYRVLTGYSLSAALGTIAAVANNRIDQVLLPLMASSQDVGFYAVAVTVAEVPLILGTLAARDALYESSRGSHIMVVLKSISLYITCAFLLSIALALFAPMYMGILFGSSFVGAIGSVQILCIGTIFGCFALTMTAVISGAGKPALSSLIPLSGLAVTALGFWLGRDGMTYISASIIAAISQAVSVLVGTVIIISGKYKSKKVAVDGIQRISATGAGTFR